MAPAPVARPNEWDVFTEEEKAIYAHCVKELGPTLRDLPDDLICMLVRGYVSEKDPSAHSVAHMIETADWRKENAIETALLPECVPANRAQFESMWRSSIIGADKDGHPIVYEAIGKIPTKEFAAAFVGTPEKEANFLAHCAYNKEILRKRNIATSAGQKKRIYKMIVVLDLAGLGMSHISSTFTGLLKTYIGKFSNLYPESLYKLYVINAPFIFSGFWGAVSVFIHPVTAAKIQVLTNPKYAIADLTDKLGAKLDVAFVDAYEKASPLSALAPQLQTMPPAFVPQGEVRATM